MTDAEIKRALECCIHLQCNAGCPMHNREHDNCVTELRRISLDLINRQQAVIEKQRENNKAMMQTIADVHTEAIKKFAERLKEVTEQYGCYIPKTIDNLVKEMVGDN